jgi:dipeptidyl aminopeptidase/acylaminoacyl peptidase
VHLTGTITLPSRSRISPPPLVVLCRDIPGRRGRAEFNRDVQAVAAMGFAVATVNYRGSAGFGAHHRDAVKVGFDAIPIEDVRATVAWIARHHPINPMRVGLLGEGFGGFIALRAAQLFPDEFRCVVSINAPTDLADWTVETSRSGWRTLPDFGFEARQVFFDRARLTPSVTDQVAATDRPVMIVQDLAKADLRKSQGTSLRAAMKRHDLYVEYLPTNAAFTSGDPGVRERVFTQIAGFLNDHIYDFRVDLGVEKEVK